MATAETGAANTPVYVVLPREADAELMRLTNFIFLITANTTPVPLRTQCNDWGADPLCCFYDHLSIKYLIFKMRKCTALRDVVTILYPLYFSTTCGVTGNWGKHLLDFWESKVFERLNLRYARSAPWSYTVVTDEACARAASCWHTRPYKTSIIWMGAYLSYLSALRCLFQTCKQQIP